jgi:hypothetical protein
MMAVPGRHGRGRSRFPGSFISGNESDCNRDWYYMEVHYWRFDGAT